MSKRIAVIGLGFGDEGKGMVTDYLCSQSRNPLVIRFSGGHQAGHTVRRDGISHTFANFGCGTLQGVPTYWSSGCTVDPVGLLNELKLLAYEMGDDVFNVKLYVNNECPVTTPYDMLYNRRREKDMMQGTCGVGFGATIEREENHLHLQVKDLFNPTVLKIKLEMIAKYYNMFLPNKEAEEGLEIFMEAVDTLKSTSLFPKDVIIPVNKMPQRFETYIYEGSQGLLLDQHIGFFPHVTRSDVGAGKLSTGVLLDEIYYVTRAYQTRHGEGPMTNEDKELFIREVTEETNVGNLYQGKFRKTILDLSLLEYAIEQDRRWFITPPRQKLVITCMDQLSGYQYTYNGCLSTSLTIDSFVETIVEKLKFDDNVYLSWSVEPTLNEWKEVT